MDGNSVFRVCALLFAGTLALVLTGHRTCAQGPEDDAAPQSGGPMPKVESLQEEKPLIYLLDRNGVLNLVPNITIEKLDRLLKLDENRFPQAPPRYTFRESRLSGEVTAGYAKLTATFRIYLTDKLEADMPPMSPPPMSPPPPAEPDSTGAGEDAGAEASVPDEGAAAPAAAPAARWVRVPLRLNQAIPSGAIRYEGQDRIVPDAQHDDGYVVWVYGAPGSEHQVTMDFKVPLLHTADETRLLLHAPPVPLKVELRIPGGPLDARLASEQDGILTVEPQESGGTRLRVESDRGAVDLFWRPRDDTPAALQVKGENHFAVIGRRLEARATLTVRSLGRPISSFQVRLPPGMERIPTSQGGIQVAALDDAPEAARAGQIVRVRARGAPQQEIEVTLAAIRTLPDASNSGVEMETSGFEVLDAPLQTGFVDFEVEGDWTVDWNHNDYVKQVSAPADLMGVGRERTRFRYFGPEYSLRLNISPKKSQLTVEPFYIVDVRQQEVWLDAILRYRISGARAKEVQVGMPGWEVERVSPADGLGDGMGWEQTDPLEIPISRSAQTASGFEIRIRARRAIADPSAPLAVTFPTPLRASIVPATVAVISADNVQLTPQPDDIVGLVPDTQSVPMPLPERQQLPLLFREEGGGKETRFVTELDVRQQSVAVAVHTDVVWLARTVKLEHRFVYDILYEPLARVRWAIPDALAEAEDLILMLGETRLTPTITRADDPATGYQHQLVIEFPQEQISRCELVASYSLPLERQAGQFDMRLPQPQEDESTTVVENTLTHVPSEFWEVELAEELWSPISGDDEMGSSALYQVDGAVDRVAFSLQPIAPHQQTSTTLVRVWLQSWLTNRVRQDRACLLLTTNEPRVELQLPRGANLESLEVALNGKPWRAFNAQDRRLTINLDNPTEVRSYTVELWYWFVARPEPIGWIPVEPPLLAGPERAHRVYWQLVLPEHEHLLWAPRTLTPEYVWQWQSWQWGRVSNREQADLEQLLEASVQEPLPRASNRYVFSSVGQFQPVAVYTARRSVLVFGLSAVALLGGLLVLYVPLFRRPAAIFLVAVIVLSVGAVFPEPTVLAAQCASLGLVLVVLARALQWVLSRRRGRRLPDRQLPLPVASDSQREAAASEGSSRRSTSIGTASYQSPAIGSES